MACNHSVAIAETLVDENKSHASIVSQGEGDINTTHSKNKQVNSNFAFNKLPIELQNKIIEYCMTATDNEINFQCLTNADYKPNVAVGLLLANHRIYHEAHYQLRKQNTFVFRNFGSDLKTIASSIGPLKCRSGACGYGALRQSLAKIVLYLGDEDLPDLGSDKTHAFGCVLKHLRPHVMVESLYVNLGFHTFRHSAELSWFAAGLRNIDVQDKMIILGDEKYLEMCFGDIPSTLGMALMPVYTHFLPYNPFIGYGPGWFIYQYVPEKHIGNVAGLHCHGHIAGWRMLSEIAGTFRERLPGRLWALYDDFRRDF